MRFSGQRRARINRMRAMNHEIRDLVSNLKNLRETSGHTPEEFADLIGRHPSSISGFENFESYPSLDMIRDYAVALNHEVQFEVRRPSNEGSYTYTRRKESDGDRAQRVHPPLGSPRAPLVL